MVVSGWASTVFGAARASPVKATPPPPKEPDWDRYFRALGDVDEPMPCRLMRAPSVESEPRTTTILLELDPKSLDPSPRSLDPFPGDCLASRIRL